MMETKTIFFLVCLTLTVSSFVVDAAINTKGDNGSIDPPREGRGFSNNNGYQNNNNNNNNYAQHNRNNGHQNYNNNNNNNNYNNVNQNNYNNGQNNQNYDQNNSNYRQNSNYNNGQNNYNNGRNNYNNGQNNYNNGYNNNNHNGYRDPVGNVWNNPIRQPVSSNPVYAESKNVPATPISPIPTDYRPDPHPHPKVPQGDGAMWVPGMTETFVISKTDDPTETYELDSEPMWDVKGDGSVRM